VVGNQMKSGCPVPGQEIEGKEGRMPTTENELHKTQKQYTVLCDWHITA
jgi:hypothetical protein